MLSNFRNKYNIQSNLQIILILLVFAFTGMSVLYVGHLLRPFFGITGESSFFIKTIYFVFITLPLYQVILLVYGFIFGQFRFFYQFEIVFFKRIFGIFLKRKPDAKP